MTDLQTRMLELGRRARAAAAALRTASRKLDKAASKGVIHKNQAANRKSGIAARVKALLG